MWVEKIASQYERDFTKNYHSSEMLIFAAGQKNRRSLEYDEIVLIGEFRGEGGGRRAPICFTAYIFLLNI